MCGWPARGRVVEKKKGSPILVTNGGVTMWVSGQIRAEGMVVIVELDE